MALITGLKGGTTNITVSYGGQTTTVSNFTVNKKTVTFTAPTLKSVSAYTRSSQTLVKAGSCTTGGTMYYYVSTSSSTPTFSVSSWTTTVPSKKDAGTYYLWYCAYVSDTGAYTGTGINTVTKVGTGSVTIPKQTPVLSTSPTKKADWSYNGTEYALASGGAMKHSSTDSTAVAGTFTYAKATNPGTYTASWSFTPTDTTNYNSTSGNVGTVTVSKATPITNFVVQETTYPTKAYVYFYSNVAGTIYETYNGTELTSSNYSTAAQITKSVSAGDGSSTNGCTVDSGSSANRWTIYVYFVPDDSRYNHVKLGPKTLIVNPAPGAVSISNSNVAYNSGKNLVSVSNATGTVYYRLGTSGSFSTTIPTATSSLNATSYTLYYYVAASSNYTEFGNASSPKSLNVTIAKVSNQITISDTSKTIYDRSGYNSFYLKVSNHKGTPTTSVNASGKVTISSFDSTNARFTVTYAGAGSVTITVSDSSTNYTSSSATCVVTTKVDTISSYGSVSAPSVSQKTNFTASGVTLTSSNMSTYFTVSGSTQTNTWASGYKSSGNISYSWSVSSGTVASKGTTISNASTVSINATVTASGEGSETASTPVTSGTQSANALTNTNYSPSNYTASVSIGNGLTAGGGSATVTASASHKAYDYYTSGSYNNQHTVTDTAAWAITTQTFTPSGGSASTITRFSKSNNTLSHTSMTSNVGTDYVKITATNSSNTSTTSTAEKSITNELGTQKYKNTSGTTGYNIVYNVPTVTIGSGLSAAGGSTTVTCSVTNGTNWYQKYTSGTYTSQKTSTETGTARWMITSNGNSRFSHPSSGGTSLSGVGTVYNSGTSVSHSSMGTTATTDTVTVTAYNTTSTSATATATKSITNTKDSTNYSPSNYTVSVSIGNGLTAGGGSATVTASASHKAYDYYTSGSYNNQHTVTDTAAWAITTQTFTPSGGSASTITRFSKSNNTLSHTSMTSNVGTDYVKITATNSSNTSTTSTAEKSITNELGTQKYKNTSGTTGYNIVYNVPTVTIGSGLSAAGGSTTVTCSVTNGTNWYQKYTSGTYTSQKTSTETGTARWMITSNGNSRFSHPSSGGTSLSGVGTVYNTGTKISHSNMTTNATTDTVTVTAYNIGDISKTKTASASVSNALTSISLSLGSSSINYNSTTTATVTATYTSGSSKDVTSSLSTSPSATSNYIKSGDTSIVTIS